ncbi:MAG: NAD-dependent epimerase/dehydratase family protein [Acidobacteriaceae bacterium]|nr:NAD-dependent epimerase/dehydratase family protein [Acidobacteriaceae bacterium]
MRILVIGGNGFLGRPLVTELVRHGHNVAVLHRNPADSQGAQVEQMRGDRNRLADSMADIRHFAPQIIVDMILSSANQADEIAEFARTIGARVVAISSMDVYRAFGIVLGSESGPLEPMPLTEDSALRTGPRSYPPEVVKTMKQIFTWLDENYDKVAVEQAIMRAGTANTIVRLPMVYGPGDPLHRMYGVLRRVADGRAAIILPDDHAAWRGPRGYVGNVAHAIALAATSDAARGRTYHICEEPCLTELEWQQQIAAQANWGGKFVVLPKAAVPPHLFMPGNAAQHVVAKCDRIRNELGYREPFSTSAAIRQTIAWEGENPPATAGFHRFDYAAEDAALAP